MSENIHLMLGYSSLVLSLYALFQVKSLWAHDKAQQLHQLELELMKNPLCYRFMHFLSFGGGVWIDESKSNLLKEELEESIDVTFGLLDAILRERNRVLAGSKFIWLKRACELPPLTQWFIGRLQVARNKDQLDKYLKRLEQDARVNDETMLLFVELKKAVCE